MNIFLKLFIFFFVFVTRGINPASLSTSAAQVSFADHCAPHYSPPQSNARVNSSVHRLTGFYYSAGGTDIHGQNTTYGYVQNSLQLVLRYDGAADEQGLFMVQGVLRFPRDSIYSLVGNSTSVRQPFGYLACPTRFRLNGIWSESSGKLCMVGSGSGKDSKRGNAIAFPAVLKLYKLKSLSSLTSLITGTFESLATSKNDANYFGSISISMLPSMSYQYNFVSNKSLNRFSDGSDPQKSLQLGRLCRLFSDSALIREFQLIYSSHCTSSKNCSPLDVLDLPLVISLEAIECLEEKQRLRVLVDFAASGRNQQRFDPSTTLVGEGSWDANNNQLGIVACRFLNATSSMSTSHVGDCSTRLTLRFPTVWTIGHTSCIVGKIWSSKSATEGGYFKNITFESSQRDLLVVEGQKYEYTKMDKVSDLCPKIKTASNDQKNHIYPNPFSFEMRFDVSAKSSTGKVGWGYSVPLSVDNQFYQPYWYSLEHGTEEYLGPVSAPVSDRSSSHRYNISYTIFIQEVDVFNLSSGLHQVNTLYEMEISAEGVYDDREGSLCMVGCRYLTSKNRQLPTYDSVDCDIVVSVQFLPTNPTNFSSSIKGSIKSTRRKYDPLYFKSLEFTSAVRSAVEAERSIWRMDVEIILVIISNTLACVFGALQLSHVKKHPDVLPSISVFMLFILALGYMIPLMLNFDAVIAVFTQHRTGQTAFLGSGWLELNEVIIRVITMVGFLLQIRLLQLTMSAKTENGNNNKNHWQVEKLALFVALPVYIAGSLVGLLLMYWRKHSVAVMVSSDGGHPIIGTILKSCASLVLDAFLFPQILLNIFSKSTGKALSTCFYIGTTLVRVLPHAYELYRTHTSTHQLEDSYIYAKPAADFYSTTAWNAITPCGGLLFAAIIYLQQLFGGRCIVPQNLGDLNAYQKVSTVDESL